MRLKTMAAVAAVIVGGMCFAHDLDTSVSNEFWCCWFHTNVVVNAQANVLPSVFSSTDFTEGAGILDKLQTNPWGLLLLFK